MDMDEGPCGVCISSGGGEDCLPEFINEQDVKARKAHKCCECGDVIAIGQTYERVVGKWRDADGGLSTYRTCLPCAEIRCTLCCEGWTYTMLWEEAEESAFQYLTTGCLAQLTTAAAKAKLLEKWRAWKGL